MATQFAIVYTEKALASLGTVPTKKIRRQIKAKIDGLALLDPHAAGVVKVP